MLKPNEKKETLVVKRRLDELLLTSPATGLVSERDLLASLERKQ